MPIQLGNLTLYSILELSEKLGITSATLRAYMKNGKLRGQKMGTKWYISEESLREFFNAGASAATSTLNGSGERAT